MSTTIEQMRDDYDWGEVFNVVSRVTKCEGAQCDETGFGLGDVKRVIASDDGENDGPNWVCVVELNDGRYAFVSSWCDYTGWGCQDGGEAWVSHSLDNLKQFGMTDEARSRLKELAS